MGLIQHRITARTLLQADSGRFLLLLTHWDPGSGLEPRWVCPGGGIEPAEPLKIAACRELLEETGLRVLPEDLGEITASLEFSQNWSNGDYETGVAEIFHLRVGKEFTVDRSMWTPEEHRDILAEKWWLAEELKEQQVLVGPPGLLELMFTLRT